ncbi:hypothetical protein ACS7SF_21380 (plasmid) [Ralstonia sp. 25C]|uniref:hypothetical protein n=1 Tax=Ralstonia sp. 25C TaxID=3447363 RepID=UPI003F7512DE
MDAGRIHSGPLSRATSPDPVATQTGAGAATPESQPASTRRSRGRAANAPGRAPGASGRAPGASGSGLSRRVNLPSQTAVSTLPVDDLKQQLDKALKMGAATGKALAGVMIGAMQHPGQQNVESHLRQVDIAAGGVKAANEGLEAFAQLKQQGHLANPHKVEADLLSNRATAAMSGIQALDRMRIGIGSQHAKDALDSKLDVLKAFQAVVADTVQRSKSADTPRAVRDKLRPMLGGLNEGLCLYNRLMRASLGAAVDKRGDRFFDLVNKTQAFNAVLLAREFVAATSYRRETTGNALLDLHDHSVAMARTGPASAVGRLPADRLEACVQDVEAFRHNLDQVGTALCLEAADRIEMNDNAGLWKSVLDLAHAIGDYQAILKDLCDSVAGPKPAASAPLDDWLPVAAALKEAEPQPSASTSRKSRKQGKRPVVQSTPKPTPAAASAQAAAPADPRIDAQKHADTLLKKYPTDRLIGARSVDDVVAAARTSGKDTSSIETAMRDPRRDAVKTVDFVRASVRNWFGEAAALQRARASLPAGDTRIAQLAERLQAFGLMEQHLNAWEADELKRDALPRSNHLDRLLKGGQIEHVGAPVRLPAAGDVGNRGTVFEIGIQPKAFSNQRPAAPLFVHVHTSEPVEPAALQAMRFNDFAKVHLKTAKQKKLGPRWEAVMHALGHTDAKVHRAAVGPTLLNALFERMQAPS